MCGCGQITQSKKNNKIIKKYNIDNNYDKEINCNLTLEDLINLKTYYKSIPLSTELLRYEYSIINSQINVFNNYPCKYYNIISKITI